MHGTDAQNEAPRYLAPIWYRTTQLVAVRGRGAYLYDEQDRAYLDFTSGIGVTNTGHCHPRVVQAIQEQAGKLIHGQANIAWHPQLIQLSEELVKIMPAGIDRFFFSNSGAEAIEGALKLARAATGRPNVIVFQGSFHGRTVGTMSLTTSKTIYRAGYQPLMPGVFVSPFPYTLRFGWDPETTSAWCLQELEFILTTQTSPSETAALLVEPVLGEGGYIVPPGSFLRGLREIADRYGLLLIFDEIQTGFGRTGAWLARDHFAVEPDIITLAKGLASGLPLSAVASRGSLMERWPPGSHGGTYGGNPIAAAAAIATIEAIREEGLLQNAVDRGHELEQGLHKLQQRFGQIAEVRGLGLMVACEFRKPDGSPDKHAAQEVVQSCFEQQLLLLTCGPWDNTIRFIPPLIVDEEQIGSGLAILEQALEATFARV